MNNYFYQGHLVKKSFGQNFLNDQFVINNIISAINPQKDQAIVEVGPGLAALTEPICKHLDYLTVIELDQDLVTRLKTHPSISSKLDIYQQDAITMNFSRLSEKIGKPLRVFGNLPYNISIPLLFSLIRNHISIIVDMHFMLQKEIANRLLAKPNSKVYGHLSVIAQCYVHMTPILEVSSAAFIPSPKVDSMVIKLVPHVKLPYPVKDFNVLNYITKKAFNQRRKMIHNSLETIFNIDELIKIGICPTMRAENISATQYRQMANYVSKSTTFKDKLKLYK